jgi:hypothetical protein
VEVSQWPVLPAWAAQSPSTQHPLTHFAPHFLRVPVQVKSHEVPLQVAVALAGGVQGTHESPQVAIAVRDTQFPLHRCCVARHMAPPVPGLAPPEPEPPEPDPPLPEPPLLAPPEPGMLVVDPPDPRGPLPPLPPPVPLPFPFGLPEPPVPRPAPPSVTAVPPVPPCPVALFPPDPELAAAPPLPVGDDPPDPTPIVLVGIPPVPVEPASGRGGPDAAVPPPVPLSAAPSVGWRKHFPA